MWLCEFGGQYSGIGVGFGCGCFGGVNVVVVCWTYCVYTFLFGALNKFSFYSEVPSKVEIPSNLSKVPGEV